MSAVGVNPDVTRTCRFVADGPKAEVAPFDEQSVVSQNTAVAKRRLRDT
jgi:hypothetical protein